MEKFVTLKVWQKARILVKAIYEITKKFPRDETFSLISQMRRAALSVAANIAEATKRKSNKDRVHFHSMADGSLEELKCFLYLSYDLGFISKEEGEKLINLSREVGRMLAALDKTITAL